MLKSVLFSCPRLPAAPDDPDVLKRGQQDRKVRPISMFESTEPSTASLRKNQSSDDLARDAQVSVDSQTQASSTHPVCGMGFFFNIC